ncbi:hypothetical protein FRC04_000153 [Tulasnella sp. 424]|nr:hypothetical protein FRC04_000153 [Tulasnella sp. 424]KAG8982016.1 hypothetical protein FRC05_000158 [Tulasnella sp. 425]
MALKHPATGSPLWKTLLVLALVAPIAAQPASIPFTDCSSSSTDLTHRINISSVYAQIADYGEGPAIKYVAIGQTNQPILGATSSLLATLFKTTSVLNFDVDETITAFCGSIRSPTSLVPVPDDTNCTIPAGPVAFTAWTSYRHDFSLTTVSTRLRAVDASSPSLELACLDIQATPVHAHGKGGYYGRAEILFWVSVGLAIAYWIVVGLGRIAAAWHRGGSGRIEGWGRIKWAGTVLSSAISGERLSASPALLRFSTPSLRDIIFHTQWCAGLAMVAVQWPGFTYPILRNAAWATLIYNVTLIQGSDGSGDHWDATQVKNYTPSPDFADQIASTGSPLFLDETVPNTLLLFPEGTKSGMSSFAYSVGIRPQDLFGTCLAIYLSIVAATIIISLFIWFFDWFISSLVSGSSNTVRKQAARSPRYSAHSDGVLSKDLAPDSPRVEELALPQPPNPRFTVQSRKAWWNYRLGQNSFHRDILYGNLVRILLLFHIPITLFSCYQFSLGRPDATIPSLALASVAFTFLSLGLPVLLLSRVALTSTTKLYEATRTLLSLGPLYYYYSPGQQHFAYVVFAHNLVFAVVVGAGQKSGTAQAIILLISEVLAALATSMWLPWGEGAHMGGLSFMFCVLRIITCVLLVILSPVVNVGSAAGGWIAYAILIINALVYIMFALMLFVKITEALVRLIGRVPFDRSRHSMDSGLLGAIGLLPYFRRRRRNKSRRPRNNPSRAQRDEESEQSRPQSRYNSSGSSHPLMDQTPPRGQGPYQLKAIGTTTSVPSYLRPEQASTPYQEDGDDPDAGYILGAFHDDFVPPSQTRRQSSASTPTSSQGPQAPSTGFARIKGGKAHFDSPFAIRMQSPPSASEKRQQRRPPNITVDTSVPPPSSTTPTSPLPLSYQQVATTSTTSLGNGSRPSGLAAHGRKKSETAIIEDAASVFGPPPGSMPPPSVRSSQSAQPRQPSPSARRTDNPLPPPPIIPIVGDDESSDSSVKPRRKFWFGGTKPASDPAGEDSDAGHESDQENSGGGMLGSWPFRRGRNKSEGDAPAASTATAEVPPVRSFQVVRQPKPQRPGGAPSSWRRPSTAPDQLSSQDQPQRSVTPTSPESPTRAKRKSSPYT